MTLERQRDLKERDLRDRVKSQRGVDRDYDRLEWEREREREHHRIRERDLYREGRTGASERERLREYGEYRGERGLEQRYRGAEREIEDGRYKRSREYEREGRYPRGSERDLELKRSGSTQQMPPFMLMDRESRDWREVERDYYYGRYCGDYEYPGQPPYDPNEPYYFEDHPASMYDDRGGRRVYNRRSRSRSFEYEVNYDREREREQSYKVGERE